jgi:hypothetical protein
VTEKIFFLAMSGPKIPAELIEQADRVLGGKEAARAWFGPAQSEPAWPAALDEVEAGGEAIVATILDGLGSPENNPES